MELGPSHPLLKLDPPVERRMMTESNNGGVSSPSAQASKITLAARSRELTKIAAAQRDARVTCDDIKDV